MDKERWLKEVYGPAKARAPERGFFTTSSGIELPPVYTPEDLDRDQLPTRLGLPGEYPYTRGVHPTMYRSRFWTMRQYAGFGTARDANRRFHLLLASGQMGLSVAFDLPTQMGRDSDHPRARGEVGRAGVAIASVRDMDELFGGIPLDRVSTSMTINATAPILLALYAAIGEQHGVVRAQLSGTVQNDILKEYIARGTYIYPPAQSMRLVTDLIAFTAKEMPRWNPISVSGYHIREAGSTAAQEVGFTLANAIAYVEAAIGAGLAVDEFAPHLSFFFNVHNHFLEEVAKFRAARRLWARVMKERFKAKDPRSMMLRFHAQTAGSTLTAQQPDNNVVRVTLQALAAVLGGCQSLHTNSKDEALALPTEEAALLALRTQQVIAHESGVTDTADPMGGAFAVEHLTDELESRGEAYIRKIDELGGVVRAIAEGYIQREIDDAAYAYQRAIESKTRVVVGVNEFATPEAPPKNLLRIDAEAEERACRRLREIRTQRDAAAANRALDELRRETATRDNLMPAIVSAVKSMCTVGEISDAFRDVFGEFREHA
jgi:methylmalonyl-CoA mutase, N-terminal domain